MKEEDKSKLVEVFNGSLLGSRTCKKVCWKNNGIESTLKRRDGSKHCPARDSSRCSSTRQ